MKRSEALRLLHDAQNEVVEAQTVLYWRQLDLEEAECDHPDTTGHVCDYCGVFDDNPERFQDEDDYRVLMADANGLVCEQGHTFYSWNYTYPVPA